MSDSRFRLIAPPPTPFDSTGSLRLAAVDAQAELLTRTGVDCVFVNGTTGECTSLTIREREQIAAEWATVARRRNIDVFVQVGDNCQAHAVQLAAHAQQIGADATAAFSPSYFRPQDVETLIRFLQPIAAAASDLPFYFYDIPPTTNVRLPMIEFLEKAKPRIPNLVGLKYSNTDLVQMQECLRLNGGEFELLFGCDEIMLAGLAFGAHGAIGSTYNFAAPLYQKLIAAFESGDIDTARACQLRSVDLIRTMARFGFLAACKDVMALFGVDCGPVRPPLQNLTEEQRRQLRTDVAQLDVFEYSRPSAPPTRCQA